MRRERLVPAVCLCLSLTLGGCNLLVTPPPGTTELPPPPGSPRDQVQPLSALERLRFSWENLGEVSPGLLYRSADTNRCLLEFLVERCRLGHVLNLRGRAPEEEREIVERAGGTVTALPLSVARPPAPREILEMVRLTHRARREGRSLLIHCLAGADRTGLMVAMWRMLFQGVTDRTALRREMWLHRHVSLFHPVIQRTLDLFRPELFRPFAEDPALLDDPERVADLESRYWQGQPLLSGNTRLSSGPLRAGVAKADLLEGLGDKVQMATYGPSPGISRGVREPVQARALFLEAGTTRLALVSCDLLIADLTLRARVLEILAERQVPVDDLLLAATHTHSSIGGYVDHWAFELYILGRFQASLREHLARRIAAAVQAARADLQPARLGAGRAFLTGVSCNRRLGRTIDPEVGIIKITGPSGRPRAAAAIFAAHPILEPSDGLLSPDFPGLLARRLDERYGFGLFFQGALGDVNACLDGDLDRWREEGLAEEVAERLERAVAEVYDTIPVEEEVTVGSMTSWFELPSANIPWMPDLLFPLEWLLGRLASWPRYVPLQAVRIGPAALVASSSEAAVRLGLQIKRRSPAPYPFVITHANGYAGYAVTAVSYARRKLDPTALVCLGGPAHGSLLVERACDLLEAQWGERLDPDAPLLSPAGRERLERLAAGASPARREELAAELRAEEEEESLARADATLPQSRSLATLAGDSLPEDLRLEIATLHLERLRGGDSAVGRRREVTARLRLRGPWDLRIEARGGHARSDWEVAGVASRIEGLLDPEIAAERPLWLWSDRTWGNALRWIPRLSLGVPAGKTRSDAPFAFSPGTGVWRPGAGFALECVWETYRTLKLEALYATATGRRHGRRPGDRWSAALRYSERHGLLSLSLDLRSALALPDSRRGGRSAADVDETSFELALEPGVALHIGRPVELFARASVPLLRGGDGAGAGWGGWLGLGVGF